MTDTSGTTTYTWNARDQLIGLSGPSVTASFAYDAVGRRKSKTVNGTTTNFLYDGLNVVQELNGATPTANLLTSLGIDEALLRTDAAGARSFLTDGLGSTLALTDNAGLVQSEYTYEPFGKTAASGAASTNAFKYTGREDGGTGLYYYRARYYHPTLQRFISEDPIGFRGGDVNLYGYVGNDPVNFVDPWGLKPGDLFGSPGQAAADAINYINPTSINENQEYGGWIYPQGGQYTYDEPTQGGSDGIPNFPPPPPGACGWYHTHGAYDPHALSEIFSPNDKAISNHYNVPGYLGTPSGSFGVYIPPGLQ